MLSAQCIGMYDLCERARLRVCDYYLWLFKTIYFVDLDVICFFHRVVIRTEHEGRGLSESGEGE